MLKITAIDDTSPLTGVIQPGDYLKRVDGAEVRDFLDYRFLTADEDMELEFVRNGEMFSVSLEKEPDQSLGLSFPPMKPAECGNHCVFCFVDQLPSGVRETLKVKDEDYRFSFLHGNFITLSNLGKAAVKRILEYRLSPLYISVHAADPLVRRKLLGCSLDYRFIEKFRALAEGGITLHTQIVVVPGYNDGDVLKDTIARLAEFHPSAASIAVIPVGLTAHRDGLPPLRLLTEDEAKTVITVVGSFREQFRRDLGEPLVCAADEMFLIARRHLPQADYYGDFPQVENGVGMIRLFLDEFDIERLDFPDKVEPPVKAVAITGKAMASIMDKQITPILNRIEGLSVRAAAVENRFLGNSVTIAGLLAGRDILQALEGMEADYIILPPDCLNADGFFLDDLTLDEFKDAVSGEVVLSDGTFAPLFQAVKSCD